MLQQACLTCTIPVDRSNGSFATYAARAIWACVYAPRRISPSRALGCRLGGLPRHQAIDVLLGDVLISWSTVSRSSADAEYRAAANAATNCIWLRQLLSELQCGVAKATVTYCCLRICRRTRCTTSGRSTSSWTFTSFANTFS